MDQRQLQIVLKLQDQASKELSRVTGALNDAEQSTSKWGGTLQFVSTWAKRAAVAVGAAAFAGVTFGVKVAAQLETAQVGLTTLLGSAEEAAKTVDRLKKEAARTPFELVGLTQAVQLLTSVTKNGDKSIDIILDVGEALAAMGKGQAELDRIIVNLQQIAATGKAATIDIKQFAFAGIPIYEMLSKETGKYGEALNDLILDGGVTFELLTKMFDNANNAGGQFFNAFKNQSGTFNQASSNMKDSIGIFFADIAKGTGIFKGLTDAMMWASTWLLNYKTNIENIRVTITDFISLIDQKTGLITLLREAWQNLVFIYEEQLKPALDKLWETLQPYKPYLEAMAQVFGTMLVVAIGLFIMIVGTLAIALTQLITWVTKIIDLFAGLFLKALNGVRDAISAIISVVETLIDKLKTAWEWAGKVVSKAGGFIKNTVSKAGDLIGLASGGPVSAGNPYIVGEKGPELFVPRSDGAIRPNMGGIGGGGISIIINGDVSGQDLIDKVTNALSLNIKKMIRI